MTDRNAKHPTGPLSRDSSGNLILDPAKKWLWNVFDEFAKFADSLPDAPQPSAPSLRFDELRDANKARSPGFKNAKGVVSDDKDWSLGERMNALVGEVGEAANIIKKLRRGDFGLDDVFEDTTETESGWLIEYSFAGGALYWDGLSADGDGVASGWTMSPNKAVRFCRESDAVAIIRVIREYGCELEPRASEHMWIGTHKSITVREALAKEIADAQCYLDKLAHAADIDLGEATRAKFNEVSERVRSEVRL